MSIRSLCIRMLLYKYSILCIYTWMLFYTSSYSNWHSVHLFTYFISTFIYRPSISSIKSFTKAEQIAIGDGYPRDVNGGTQILVVVKADKSNTLCSATSSRRRRSITLSNLEIAIPQSVLQQIMANATM